MVTAVKTRSTKWLPFFRSACQSYVVVTGRPAATHAPHLFDRDQLPPMPGVSRLPARFASRRSTLRTRRCTRRIRRRGLGRVLRIPPQLFTQLGDFGLQGGYQRLECLHLLPQGDHDRLDSGESAIPIFFCNGQFCWQWHDTTRSRQAVQRSRVHSTPKKSGVSMGIAPSFSGYMTVVKTRGYPTERLRAILCLPSRTASGESPRPEPALSVAKSAPGRRPKERGALSRHSPPRRRRAIVRAIFKMRRNTYVLSCNCSLCVAEHMSD